MKQRKIKTTISVVSGNSFTSYSGYKVNFDDDEWKIKVGITVNLAAVKELIKDELFYSYKVVLKYMVENHSANTIRSYHHAVLRYFKTQNSSDFSIVDITNYRANKKNNVYLVRLRAFLIRWHKLQEPGVSDDLIDQIKEWNLPRNETGAAVLSNDPNKCPLEDIERETFLIKSANAVENGDIAISDFAVSLIFSSLGVRSEQISQLKIKDVRVAEGRVHPYSINMPLSKKGKGFRGAFSESFLVEEIYRVIRLHVDDLVCQVRDRFDFSVKDTDIQRMPLFPSNKIWNSDSYKELLREIDGDQFHSTSYAIGKIPSNVAKKINALNRHGEPLVLNSRRLRYTFATNLVREGHDIVTTAKLLNHSGTHNVQIYFKNTVDFVKYIRERTKGQFSDFAAAFLGEVVDSSSVAKNGDRSDMQIVEENGHMGVCGRDHRCSSHPVVCYTCPNFQPLIDSDHKGLLNSLIEERSKVEKTTKDKSVIEAKDHIIKAVARVLQICQERKVVELSK